MKRHPRSTIVMDAESFDIISSGMNADKVSKEADRAVARGRTPVVIQKPRRPDT